MEADENEDNYLLVTYAKEDDGKPMKISVGDSVITDEVLSSKDAEVKNITLADADKDKYYQVMYKIPASVVKENIGELKVIENETEVTKKVINIEFSGKDKVSARICKSLVMMKAFRNTNELTSIEYDGKTITPDKDNKIEIDTTYDKVPEVKFNISDAGGYVMAGNDVVDETESKKIKTSGKVTEIKVKVYAQDFETVSEYTLVVNTDYTGLDLSKNIVKAFGFNETNDGAVAVAKASVPTSISGAKFKYVNGQSTKALSLDGTYGLKLLDDASKLGESYTISFAMKASEVGSAVNPTITAGTFSPEYWLNLTLDGKIWSHDANGYIDTTASGAYTAGKWQTVTLVVDGSKQGKTEGTVSGKLYVDGTVVTEGSVASDIMKKSGVAVYFGVNAWDAYFKGELDDVLLFNKALGESEIAAINSKVITADTFNKQTAVSNKPVAKSITVKASGLKKNVLTIVKSKKVKLKVTVSPAKANQKVTYKSSNKKIAAITSKGVVTAKKKGTAKITIKTTNGKKKVIKVKVIAKSTKKK